jgi:hypothetical protein
VSVNSATLVGADASAQGSVDATVVNPRKKRPQQAPHGCAKVNDDHASIGAGTRRRQQRKNGAVVMLQRNINATPLRRGTAPRKCCIALAFS